MSQKWSSELARLEGMVLRVNAELQRSILRDAAQGQRLAQLEQAVLELSVALAERDGVRPLPPSRSASVLDGA